MLQKTTRGSKNGKCLRKAHHSFSARLRRRWDCTSSSADHQRGSGVETPVPILDACSISCAFSSLRNSMAWYPRTSNLKRAWSRLSASTRSCALIPSGLVAPKRKLFIGHNRACPLSRGQAGQVAKLKPDERAREESRALLMAGYAKSLMAGYRNPFRCGFRCDCRTGCR